MDVYLQIRFFVLSQGLAWEGNVSLFSTRYSRVCCAVHGF